MTYDLKTFLEERNKACSGSFEDFKAYSSRESVIFSTDLVAEIAYHKCRTAIKTLSLELRQSSHEWLTSRGYESWLG